MEAPAARAETGAPRRAASGVLTLLFPTREETDLLRACLWSGEAARAAWRRWHGAPAEPGRDVAASGAVKALLPLLHHALRTNRLEADGVLRAALAAAALAEERRQAAYRTICGRAFEALSSASIRFLVLRGAALAGAAYPAPALRHCHDVDLLVHAADRRRCAAALGAAGFDAARSDDATGPDRFFDPSGLPIELHRNLFRFSFYRVALEDVAGRAREVDAAGLRCTTLSPADHLVHVCGQASCAASRDSLRWACDAWYLIARSPDLDWDVLLRVAKLGRLAVPLAALLDFLAVELGASIPGSVLRDLDAAAVRAGRAAREVALFGVRAGQRGRLRNLVRAARNGRERWDLVRWLLLPTATSVRGSTPRRWPALWPAYYAARPLSYLARRLGIQGPPRSRSAPPRTATPSSPHRRLDGGSASDAAFLRAALLLRHDPRAAAALAAGPRPGEGTDAFRDLIERERVGPLLHQAIGRLEILSPATREALRQSYRTTSLRNLLLLRELDRCLGQLAAAGVAAIVLKGAALAEPVYGNLALRPMADLDLLVHRRDLPRARGVLQDLHFQPMRLETHPGALAEHENELTFSKPGRVRVDLDVHWSLIDSPFYQHEMAMEWFWATARQQSLGGSSALTLGPEALLLHLCAHLVLHHGGTGLLWWNDIAEVLRVERGTMDWDEVFARSRAYHLLLPVREVLTRLAAEWGAAVPVDVLERLRAAHATPVEVDLFVRLGREASAGRRFWTDLASMPGWRQGLRFARTNLLPSSTYMRRRYGIRHPLLVPFYYPYRWLRGLRGSIPPVNSRDAVASKPDAPGPRGAQGD